MRGRDLRSRRHVDLAVVMCDSSNQLFFRRNRLSFFTSLLVVKDQWLVIIEKAIQIHPQSPLQVNFISDVVVLEL